MEIIKIKSNYKNSTLLRLAKKYTIDVINKDTNKVNFDDYGAGEFNYIVNFKDKQLDSVQLVAVV